MSYIGVDLHQNSITVCRRTGDGSEAFETLTLSPADMERFCLSLDADDEVAIEATGNSAWFRDQILPCVGRVVVEIGKLSAVLPDAVLPDAASGRSRVDLWAVNRALLQSAGLAAAHIDDSPPCTCCDAGSFFSYRRDGAGIGQHLAFILGGQP